MCYSTDAQIFIIDDTDNGKFTPLFGYYARYNAHYSYRLKEGDMDLDGVKNRISDDNSLKNKMELHYTKAKYDDDVRVL